MNKATLDIIGQAGLAYHHFPNFLRRNKPLTCFQPTDRSRALASSLKTTQAIGRNLISQKKSEILASAEVDAKGGVEKRNIQGRDLLTLLIKANMATDIPDNARMTDDEILAREWRVVSAG